MAKKNDDLIPILKCTCCGEEKRASKKYRSADSNFYKYHSKIYSGYGLFIPICKDCLENIYDEYINKYKKEFEESKNDKEFEEYYFEKKVIKRLCMMNDIYYDDDIFESSLKYSDNHTMFSAYMKVSNLIQYKTKNYDNTLEKEEQLKEIQRGLNGGTCLYDAADSDVGVKDDDKKSITISSKTIKFFGEGLDDNDYVFLQEQYDDWVARHECNTKAQEEIFKQICFTQLELLKATKTGEDTKDLTATFQKLLETAKLQPKQNHSETMSDAQTFGTLIDKWENTKPIPEIDEELKDVDKIGLYIDVFFKGHLAKMMGMKNAFYNLYSKFMKKYTVEKPEYKDEEDSEALFDAIFGNQDISDA